MMFWRRVQKWAGKILRSVPEKPLVYRQIVERQESQYGEIVRLECGHMFELCRNQRQRIPCPDCRNSFGERPDSPDIPPEAGSPT